MKLSKSLFLVLAVFLFGLDLQSQELASKVVVEPGWYRVEYLKFNQGKVEVARDIIEEYFVAASRLARKEVPVMELELWSNEFDYMVVWKVPEEGDALSWHEIPNDPEWYRALIAVAGDEENAKTIIEQFDSCVSKGKTETARKN